MLFLLSVRVFDIAQKLTIAKKVHIAIAQKLTNAKRLFRANFLTYRIFAQKSSLLVRSLLQKLCGKHFGRKLICTIKFSFFSTKHNLLRKGV